MTTPTENGELSSQRPIPAPEFKHPSATSPDPCHEDKQLSSTTKGENISDTACELAPCEPAAQESSENTAAEQPKKKKKRKRESYKDLMSSLKVGTHAAPLARAGFHPYASYRY